MLSRSGLASAALACGLCGCDFTHRFEDRLMADGGAWEITRYEYHRMDLDDGHPESDLELDEAGRITFWLDGDYDDWFDLWALLELPDEVLVDGTWTFVPAIDLCNWDGEDLGGAFTLADHGDFGEPEVVTVVEDSGDAMVWESVEEAYLPGEDNAALIERRYEVTRAVR
ncbi:MAG: hypothetical protein ABIO70_13485 [Pseudomonadota bacterium]